MTKTIVSKLQTLTGHANLSLIYHEMSIEYITIDAEKNNMLISIPIYRTNINLYLQIYPKTWTVCYVYQ